MYIYLGHGGSVRQRQVQAGGHHHQQVSLLQRDGHTHFFMTRYCCSSFSKKTLPLSAFTLFSNRLLAIVLFALSLILPALLLSKKWNIINERLNLAGHNPSPSSLFPTYSLAVSHVFRVQPASNPSSSFLWIAQLALFFFRTVRFSAIFEEFCASAFSF